MEDKTREEFEAQFPLPPKCLWDEQWQAYCWGTSPSRHPRNELWEAWLAAKEQYAPKYISVCTTCSGAVIGEFIDGVMHPYDFDEVIQTALPEGGK